MDIRFWLWLSGVLMFFGAGFFFASAAGAAPSAKPAGATITVNTTADENGLGPDCSLREAIGSVNGGSDLGGCAHTGSYGGGDLINFSLGGCPCVITLTFGELFIDQDLTMTGLGAANLAVSGNHNSRVFNINTGRTVAITDLTITNGYAINAAGLISNGTLTLNNVVVTGNIVSGADNGGGVYNNVGHVMSISNSSILSNTSGGAGGGIYNLGMLTITNSSIGAMNLSNSAPNGGGGIFNGAGMTLSISGSSIISNTSPNGGGGIFNYGDLTIKSSLVMSNVASGAGGIVNGSTGILAITLSDVSNNVNNAASGGGGIGNSFGRASIISSTISGNHSTNAAGSSGGIDNTNGTMQIIGSAIYSNTSAGVGGGLRNSSFGGSSATLYITNTTISGNSANTSGGGIESDLSTGSSEVRLVNVTIAGNTSVGGNGGGLANNGSLIYVKSTIVAGNFSGGNAPDCNSDLTSLGYNLIGNTSFCIFGATTGDLTDLAARLGPLANNGGGTKTHTLLPGSPAIDRIPFGVNGCGTTVAIDQRGGTRPVGPNCDMGATENNYLFLPLIMR